jgi:4-hydroxy-tetrahydrodipicolinate synthase
MSRFEGAMTALVTPFRDGKIDRAALEALVEEQIVQGIDGLVPCGTTGENTTLSPAETAEVIEIVIRATKKRVPVIAGTGANSTAKAIELSRRAKELGADALLQITPYYNKPTQEGLYQHFKSVAQLIGLPIVLYNVPGRTGVDLLPDTVARLCALPEIVALKEATGQVTRTQQIISKVGDRLTVLSGEDAVNFPLYAVGARGCISVVANVAPKLVADCWDAANAGDLPKARRLHYQALPLSEALFWESNPIPAKTALAFMGKMSAEMRLPMVPMSAEGSERLRKLLSELGYV